MHALRTVSASIIDGLAWLMEWTSRGARKLARVLRGGGQGEE
jgi:hypothetical protein